MSVTGSLRVQGSITGSVLGTATNAVSSSYAVTSSYAHFAATPTVQGVQGTQGIQGVGGSIGGQGTQGATGAQGITGIQGLQGRQGTTGIQGTNGSNGAQGIQGIQGTAGSNGVQGIQGIQGTAGSNGSQGTQGIQGTTGAQGIQGIQGVQGPNAGITSYTNASDNRVITSVNSSTINAESNLTFDGTNLATTAISVYGNGAGADPYGTMAVTEPANASNYSYYGLTRAGNIGAGFGITGTTGALGLGANSYWFGTASSGAAGVMGTAWLAFNGSSLVTVGTVSATSFTGTSTSSRFGNIVIGSGTYKNTISLNGDTNLNLSTPSGAVFFDTYGEANGSLRAPIFYDLNNTGYYLNPNGTSNVVTVNADNYYQNSGGYTQLGFTNTNTVQWPLFRFGPADTGNGWDEGIIKASTTEGVFGRYGMGIHMDSARAFGIYSSGWNKIFGFKSDEVRSYQNFYAPVVSATTHLVTPLVYSGGGSVSFGNDLTVNGNYLKFDQSGTRSWSIRASGGNLNFTSGDGSGTYTFTGSTSFSGNSSWFGGYGGGSGPGLAFENQGTFARIVFFGLDFYEWDYGLVGGINNGYIYSNTSFRAPIFYDSDNTSYYVNPSGGSYLRGVLEVTGGHYDTEIRLTANGSDLGSGVTSAMSWWVSEPNVTWNEGGFGYNVTNDAGTPSGFGRLNTSYGQAYMRMATDGNWYFYNTNTSGTRTTTMNLTPGGNVVVATDVRAPLLYDSNNTGYYLDPSSTSTSLAVNGNIDCYARSASWAEGIRIRVPSTNTWGGIRFTRDRGGNDGNWAIGFTGIDSTDDLTFWGNSGGSEAMRMRLTLGGTLTTSGDIVAYSDKRVKENISTIENALDKVTKLRGVTYSRNDVEDKSEKVGVIAQEIQEVLPQVVFEQEDGMLGVSYGNITAVLIEAIKEQQTQIENQQSQIDELKALVKSLVG
jgi:hypothetical protein